MKQTPADMISILFSQRRCIVDHWRFTR